MNADIKTLIAAVVSAVVIVIVMPILVLHFAGVPTEEQISCTSTDPLAQRLCAQEQGP